MTRKEEISTNLWLIIRRVYEMSGDAPTSDKQIEVINEMTEYVHQNYTRKKESKEKQCLTSTQS